MSNERPLICQRWEPCAADNLLLKCLVAVTSGPLTGKVVGVGVKGVEFMLATQKRGLPDFVLSDQYGEVIDFGPVGLDDRLVDLDTKFDQFHSFTLISFVTSMR